MIRRSASEMSRLRRSGPAITRSIASSSSCTPIAVASRRVASSAASFTRFARSAPVKPGGAAREHVEVDVVRERLTSRVCTARIASRPSRSGRSTTIWRSKRPGRSSAGSRMSGRFVDASRITPLFASKPSISTRSWLSVCSRSSCPPPTPAPRWRPTASISSTKMIAGAASFACWNRSRTRDAPTPTNISTKSEPLNREERHAGLARDRLREQRLAGARRAGEQHALRDPRAHAPRSAPGRRGSPGSPRAPRPPRRARRRRRTSPSGRFDRLRVLLPNSSRPRAALRLAQQHEDEHRG